MAYKPGMVVEGVATKFTNFGVFVELDEGLEGLLHISELTDKKIADPEEVVYLPSILRAERGAARRTRSATCGGRCPAR